MTRRLEDQKTRRLDDQMTRRRCRMLENIQYYYIMQYQVDPTDQTQENGQKPHFWPFGSFKNAFL